MATGTTAESAQPSGFKAEMEKNAGQMGVRKGKPKNTPAPEKKTGP